jgi:hypothetical protein
MNLNRGVMEITIDKECACNLRDIRKSLSDLYDSIGVSRVGYVGSRIKMMVEEIDLLLDFS